MPDFNFGVRIAKNKNWPCVGYYTITSGYGRRNTGIPMASTNHKGIDISCPVGTDVVAVLDGTILFTGYNMYRGYYIMVDHGNGVVTITLEDGYGEKSCIYYKVNDDSSIAITHDDRYDHGLCCRKRNRCIRRCSFP